MLNGLFKIILSDVMFSVQLFILLLSFFFLATTIDHKRTNCAG